MMHAFRRLTRMKTWVLPACLAVVGVWGPGAFADDSEQETHFKMYGGLGYVAPLSEGSTTFESFTDDVEAAEEVGWNFGIEGRFNKLIGIEVDYLLAKQDVVFGDTVIGTTNFSPLTATLNFHVVHTTVVDFYLGPSYSYVNWGEIKLNADGEALFSTNGLETDSAHGWGAGAGIDIGFGKHFVITAGLRYLNVELRPTGGNSVPVDPLIARLGVGFRF